MHVGCSAWTDGIQTWNGTTASFIIRLTMNRATAPAASGVPAMPGRSAVDRLPVWL